MALTFFSDLLNAFVFNGIQSMWSRNPVTNTSLTIFSGTQPTAAQIVSSWSTYSAQYLVHWTGVVWPTPTGYNTLGSGNSTTATTPAAQNAFRSGTATWAILWPSDGNIAEGTIQGASLPSTTFVVLPVSASGGTGCVRLTSTTITSGSSYQPTDITIKTGIV
jgi:hypothetical protein